MTPPRDCARGLLQQAPGAEDKWNEADLHCADDAADAQTPVAIEFAVGTNIRDNEPTAASVPSWDAFVSWLGGHRAKTKGGAGYICGPLLGRRSAEAAAPRRWLAFDLDRIDADALGGVCEFFTRFSAVRWATHSSTDAAPRQRVIVELSRAVTRREAIALGDVIGGDLLHNVGEAVLLDPSTYRGEQPIFLPPVGPVLAVCTGAVVDVDEYLRSAGQAHAIEGAVAPPAPQAAHAELAQRLAAALQRLDPDMQHNDWVRVGMALRHELGDAGFPLWDNWSRRGQKYPGGTDLARRWGSFKRAGITAGTIFAMAGGTPGGAARAQPQHAATEPTGQAAPPDPLAPPTLRPEGFPPLLRAIVEAACAHSEAHPVAVAANVITFYSAMVGRGPFQRIGDSSVHCRPFVLIVGRSGKARKGTAEATPYALFKRADALLRERRQTREVLRFHSGGLSTGEGLAWAIRDPREGDDKGKGADEGVVDKRLVVVEPEFANVLAQARREGNIISPTLRNLWDGRDLEPLTKTSQVTASRPHVAVIGHITGHELREKATENDTANGLLNRFVLVHVHRPKLVPLPRPTPEDVLQDLATRLADAVEFALHTGGITANNSLEVTLTAEAAEDWSRRYPHITRDREGRAGSLMARSEVYTRMLAGIFALMGGRTVIEPRDLDAALAWLDYWAASVHYVFQAAEGDDGLDPFAAEVLAVITKRPGITMTQLQAHWHNKKSTPLKTALERLTGLAPPLVEARVERHDGTGGRRPQRFFACARGERGEGTET